MLTIQIPIAFCEENEYVINYIFNKILGLDYIILKDSLAENINIFLSNNNQLILKDSFFKNLNNPLQYLNTVYLPSKAIILKNENNLFLIKNENDLPFPFGLPEINVSANSIFCEIDFISSIFFFLSRWEEYVHVERDKHARFLPKNSWAGKNDLMQRPLVDEYVEVIWEMLKFLGINQTRKELNYSVLFTHDVDEPYFFHNMNLFITKLGGDIIKRKSISNMINTLKSGIKNFIFHYDCYDTFDYLMEISEKKNQVSHFNFMTSDKGIYNNKYRIEAKKIQKLINKIYARGHKIGFHPGYESFNCKRIFNTELSRLKNNYHYKIEGGRQHFLRFEAPFTWILWADAGFDWVSTLAYASLPGFRAATCRPFHPFDFLNRKEIAVLEIPLTFMEATYLNYLRLSPEEIKLKIKPIINTVKKYNGTFVLLWHNSNFSSSNHVQLKQTYEWLVDEICNNALI